MSWESIQFDLLDLGWQLAGSFAAMQGASIDEIYTRYIADAGGVVIDLGRARCFTGGARLAVKLSERHCPWPGCSVPTSQCEIDHTTDHAQGGRTDPGNGGPFCGRHNRHKQKGFAFWRDPTGEWHVYWPDGTEIE
ncbi:MAG: HNH endonuclease signature motif containing protein [Acidimicrobiales bacterium]